MVIFDIFNFFLFLRIVIPFLPPINKKMITNICSLRKNWLSRFASVSRFAPGFLIKTPLKQRTVGMAGTSSILSVCFLNKNSSYRSDVPFICEKVTDHLPSSVYTFLYTDYTKLRPLLIFFVTYNETRVYDT